MRNALVSVVLPVRNRRQLLARAAASVLSQDYRELELIIVDDASDEDLRPVIDSLNDARVRYLRLERNAGPAAARNRGIEVARGEYIAFQDSDDQWLQNKLRRQVEILAGSTDDVGLVYTDICRFVGRAPSLRPGPALRVREGDLREAALGDGMLFAYVQSWLLRRAAIQALGGFDETLRLWEDWELCIRLTQRWRVAYLPGVHVLSQRVGDSISADMSLWLPALRRIVDKHGDARGRGAARLHYTLARFELLSGDTGRGWRALRQSLTIRPSFKAIALGTLALARLQRRILLGRNPATAGG